MPTLGELSDDYVAKLLTKDAKESTTKYSALGLQALLPKRPTNNVPRANTRFLKNIIRETDSHNAALKAKETEESRLRLKRLGHEDRALEISSSRKRRDKHYGEDTKHSRKRRRAESDDDVEDEQHRDRKCHDPRSRSTKGYRSSTKSREEGRLSPPPGLSGEEDEKSERKSKHHRKHHKYRSRSRSEHHPSRKSDSRKHKERSSSRSLHRDVEHRKSRRRKDRSLSRSPSPERKSCRRRRKHAKAVSSPLAETNEEKGLDSDPLEAIVGPVPPPPVNRKIKFRGRGTFSSSTAIDNHFSNTYDPSADAQPKSDSEEDWDQAIEAFRDRQKWKQQGAERLKAAGFTDEEIKKWEKSGTERSEADVRWNLKGEGREWDRGKVVGEDGSIETGVEWGRLKGT
ncbi:MAG: hypothetical protein MMC33_009072 [Icmadophila ericetorum]|nr:hypothetical protein [Icmadophila ericetorum]